MGPVTKKVRKPSCPVFSSCPAASSTKWGEHRICVGILNLPQDRLRNRRLLSGASLSHHENRTAQKMPKAQSAGQGNSPLWQKRPHTGLQSWPSTHWPCAWAGLGFPICQTRDKDSCPALTPKRPAVYLPNPPRPTCYPAHLRPPPQT